MASPGGRSLASDAKNDEIDSVLQANKPPAAPAKTDNNFDVKKSTSGFSTTLTGASHETDEVMEIGGGGEEEEEEDSKWDSEDGSDPVSNAVDTQAFITDPPPQPSKEEAPVTSPAPETEVKKEEARRPSLGVVATGSMNLETDDEEEEEESTWERELKRKRVSISPTTPSLLPP